MTVKMTGKIRLHKICAICHALLHLHSVNVGTIWRGRFQFDPPDPITPGETGAATGWEAGRIPEPALEHIAAAVPLITHSNHYSPLGSYGGSMSSVRPSDQTDEHEKRTVHFVLCRYKMPCLWRRFPGQRHHFTHKSTVINGQTS
jgi:hypothetical protein